ncbi:hypothetical protein LU293_08080 [Moraxella nasovis]|uniref:DUF6978 family protein n=1 Tax=Moraxella nasovis TaxID=2904121 RepID=UPI001F600FCF|nr:hypothetical protein [Moraxella nasovis]UNU73031.1 hypothetical protein LU293_08080 [Moraxella nasovis]
MITDEQARAFIEILKHILGKPIDFDFTKKVINIKDDIGREEYLLDIIPNRIKPSKISTTLRVRKNVLLVRLDVNGPPHRNPDDTEIPCPHLHVYKQGYELKWAYPVPPIFGDCTSLANYLDSFCQHCNIRGKIFLQIPIEYHPCS